MKGWLVSSLFTVQAEYFIGTDNELFVPLYFYASNQFFLVTKIFSSIHILHIGTLLEKWLLDMAKSCHRLNCDKLAIPNGGKILPRDWLLLRVAVVKNFFEKNTRLAIACGGNIQFF